MWVLTKIDPTTFNAVSDLIAKVVAGLLLATLGVVYPQMFCRTRSARLLLLIVSIILIVSTFSHVLADFFLNFVVVEVGSNETLFIGSKPRGVSTYKLIGDRLSSVSTVTIYGNDSYYTDDYNLTDPTGPVAMALLVEQADLIAKGLSRLSFLPPSSLDQQLSAMWHGETPKAFPGDLGIQCHGSPDYKNIYEMVSANLVTILNTTQGLINDAGIPFSTSYSMQDYMVDFVTNLMQDPTVQGAMIQLNNHTQHVGDALGQARRLSFLPPLSMPGINGVENHYTNYSLALLDCDYEETTPYKTISETPSENGWRVADRISFENTLTTQLNNNSNLADFAPNDGVTSFFVWAVAVLNEELADTKRDPFEPNFRFTENETVLPVSRGFQGWFDLDDQGNKARFGGEDDWQIGRRVRDGLTFRLGHVWWMNDTMILNRPHPGSIEFQVEYSLLTGPGATIASTGDIQYTLSSWSRNCPFQDPDTKEISLIVSSPSLNTSEVVAGCVIDFALECTSRFPEDVDLSANTTLEVPLCLIWDFDVTLLSGNIVVDPYMLAAYAGIATRNKGLNDLLGKSVPLIAVNSLAAAYVLTRETVSGTVAKTGVRASIGPTYIVFMILPLLCILPLLGFVTRRAPPVPRSIWDILVLARGDDNIPRRGDSDYSYPPRPKKLGFGITISEQAEGGEKLGLGVSFVPLTHPFPEPERESGRHKMQSKNGSPADV